MSLVALLCSPPINVKVKRFKHSLVLCIAARYGANIRRALSESYRWDIAMLLEEL